MTHLHVSLQLEFGLPEVEDFSLFPYLVLHLLTTKVLSPFPNVPSVRSLGSVRLSTRVVPSNCGGGGSLLSFLQRSPLVSRLPFVETLDDYRVSAQTMFEYVVRSRDPVFEHLSSVDQMIGS